MRKNRYTKNFVRKNKRYIGDGDPEQYYLLSQTIRKELLSDILEYEAYLADLLIESMELFSLSLNDIKKYNKNIKSILLDTGDLEGYVKEHFNIDERYNLKLGTTENINKYIKIGSVSRLINDIYPRTRYGKNVKLRVHFESLSMGSKVHLIKNIIDEELLISVNQLIEMRNNYFSNIKDIGDPIHNFLFPVIEYIRDIRNILCHRNIALNPEDLFQIAFMVTKRKYNQAKMMEMVRDQLLILHDKEFHKRVLDKLYSNPKINNEIVGKIFAQKHWNII